MSKFLIDENLSPKIALFLNNLGYQTLTVRDVPLKGAPDEEIIDFAQRENWVIITQDLGFGETFYFNRAGKISMIILRGPKQSLSSLQNSLTLLHKEGVLKENLKKTLIVASPSVIRRRRSFPNK